MAGLEYPQMNCIKKSFIADSFQLILHKKLIVRMKNVSVKVKLLAVKYREVLKILL